MWSPRRNSKSTNIACIFVHAGAGYHSQQNEHLHLQACNDAAKSAMHVMRGGGSAVDAVEIAIRILEDREITNAGYGSNLAIDGVVECDAVVVDHHGRSGGAGAVAQVKNPISLARLLLDHTTRTLSLRRVPPNLLVGQGATDFAYEHGMPVVPHDCLISPAAKERWRKWRDDLDKAEQDRQAEARQFGSSPLRSRTDLQRKYNEASESEQARISHVNAMHAGVWNEAQPISPPSEPYSAGADHDSSSSPSRSGASVSSMSLDRTSDTTPDSPREYIDPFGPPGMLNTMSKNPFASSIQMLSGPPRMGPIGLERGSDPSLMGQLHDSQMDNGAVYGSSRSGHSSPISRNYRYADHDGSSGSDSDGTTIARHATSPGVSSWDALGYPGDAVTTPLPRTAEEIQHEGPTPQAPTPLRHVRSTPPLPPDPSLLHDLSDEHQDLVTDTVGAIAIDIYGNVACGASSGGIGMKHRGRIGPAALVSIGAAVIPPDPQDAEGTAVATVTSGTGEHMGTTMAASTCSERVYQGVRKVSGGAYEQCCDDEAINAFIQKDFMGHSSVKQSHSSGAIGLLSVKRTREGVYLYFGHNTDSFALASMHSDESKPVCTMSRSKGDGVIAQGGRAIRMRKKRKAH